MAAVAEKIDAYGRPPPRESDKILDKILEKLKQESEVPLEWLNEPAEI